MDKGELDETGLEGEEPDREGLDEDNSEITDSDEDNSDKDNLVKRSLNEVKSSNPIFKYSLANLLKHSESA